jgi:hypothetical protein
MRQFFSSPGPFSLTSSVMTSWRLDIVAKGLSIHYLCSFKKLDSL